MYRWLVIVASALAVGGSASPNQKQLPPHGRAPERGAGQVVAGAHHMPIAVEGDRIRIGEHEFVPRFTNLPAVLVVPAGQTFTLPPDSTWDYIEVAGRLVVSRAYDTTVRFTHLVVLPGGRLDAGTAEEPILGRVEFIIRDVPIDTARDPFQWGNGILNFGTQTRVGLEKTPFVEMEDAPAVATALTLATIPHGWQIGDELLLPDMAQVDSTRSRTDNEPRRESPMHIAGISGNVVTLSKPLDFEHESIRDPDGGLVLRPRVANLTRNIVIRNENPNGTRGHTANVSAASWDIRANQFIGQGRTCNDVLDSTTLDDAGNVTHIGTCQIGRYADHHHHAGSRPDLVRLTQGNVYDGARVSKWAVVDHGTHDTVVANNVCIDTPGACYVTEDGNEIRNVYRANVAAYSQGTGSNIGLAKPGTGGAGFWFHGVQQIIEGNEAWNNNSGIAFVNQDHLETIGPIPSTPGGQADTPFDDRIHREAIRVAGNVAAANKVTGLELWATGPFPIDDLIAANNGSRQVWPANSERINLYLRRAKLICTDSRRASGVEGNSGYVLNFEIEVSEIRGCVEGINRGMARGHVFLTRTLLQNVTNLIYFANSGQTRMDTVEHRPLGANPPRYIEMRGGVEWQPGTPLPRSQQRYWKQQEGSQHAIINWQGTGRNYRLLSPAQRRSMYAWPARPGARPWLVPEEGLTMGEAWDKYGLAFQGDVIADGQAAPLEGLVDTLARPGLDRPLGQPRAVMTIPNLLGPASVDKVRGVPSVLLYFMLTGLREGVNLEEAFVSIDGSAPEPLLPLNSPVDAEFRHLTTATAPGRHEVRTWRVDLKGERIPSSEMVFHYFIAEAGASVSGPGSSQ